LKVVVVQARMGSSRLPGKVAMDLLGRPVLAHVLGRAGAIPGADAVCCAIPEGPADDALAALAGQLGARVVRGSETDVLARYLAAARACDATAVVRVTSDCPVLDPQVGGRVLAQLTEAGAAYASNVDPRSWPKGLDTEAFTREALERTAAEATEAYDREHVTPYMRRAPGFMRANTALPEDRCADWRWTLDYPEDLTFLRELLGRAGPEPQRAGFEELKRIVEADPAIARINAHLT